MLGDTLTVLVEPTNRVLNKINQDNYSSEYLWVGTLSQIRARVRHTKTTARNGRPAYDRHNLEIVLTTFATETKAEYDSKVYVVFEHLPGDDEVIKYVNAMSDMLIADTDALTTAMLGWQS